MAQDRLVIDANIFLEALLKQERAWECASFLSKLQERSYFDKTDLKRFEPRDILEI